MGVQSMKILVGPSHIVFVYKPSFLNFVLKIFAVIRTDLRHSVTPTVLGVCFGRGLVPVLHASAQWFGTSMTACITLVALKGRGNPPFRYERVLRFKKRGNYNVVVQNI